MHPYLVSRAHKGGAEWQEMVSNGLNGTATHGWGVAAHGKGDLSYRSAAHAVAGAQRGWRGHREGGEVTERVPCDSRGTLAV